MMKHIALGLILCGFFALRVSAQSSLKEDEIPKDLVIKLSFSSTARYSPEYDVIITADGKVYLEYRSEGLPLARNFSDLSKNKSKKVEAPRLEDRLSKKQIKEIIGEFEKSGFFGMNESYYGDPNLELQTCVNHSDTKALSVSANGKTKKVAFYLGCNYGEESPLKSFLALYDKIDKKLSGVKKIDLKKQRINAKK